MSTEFQDEIEETGGTLVIQSDSQEEVADDLDETIRKISEGGAMNRHVLNFASPELFRKLLTPKRLEMIEWLMNHDRPDSIRGLARSLDRGKGEVHDDLDVLEQYGIVYYKEVGRAKQPFIPFEEIDIDIKIRTAA